MATGFYVEDVVGLPSLVPSRLVVGYSNSARSFIELAGFAEVVPEPEPEPFSGREYPFLQPRSPEYLTPEVTLVYMTQAEFDAVEFKDPNTLYVVEE